MRLAKSLIKKVLRDKDGVVDEVTTQELVKELDDVLWYIAKFATDLGISMNEIAWSNLENIFSRNDCDQLRGSGDNRSY